MRIYFLKFRGESGEELSTTTATSRREISPSNLHISSFVIVKKKGKTEREYSILLLRAGEKNP
jgi:hypothetical protein